MISTIFSLPFWFQRQVLEAALLMPCIDRRTTLTFLLFPPPQKNRSLPSDSSPETPTPAGMSSCSTRRPFEDQIVSPPLPGAGMGAHLASESILWIRCSAS
jgi:hypothetical protein